MKREYEKPMIEEVKFELEKQIMDAELPGENLSTEGGDEDW